MRPISTSITCELQLPARLVVCVRCCSFNSSTSLLHAVSPASAFHSKTRTSRAVEWSRARCCQGDLLHAPRPLYLPRGALPPCPVVYLEANRDCLVTSSSCEVAPRGHPTWLLYFTHGTFAIQPSPSAVSLALLPPSLTGWNCVAGTLLPRKMLVLKSCTVPHKKRR